LVNISIDSHLARLFRDTGIFPNMHVVVVRNSILGTVRNLGIAVSASDPFDVGHGTEGKAEARAILERMSDEIASLNKLVITGEGYADVG
jgi:hypothetical protein